MCVCVCVFTIIILFKCSIFIAVKFIGTEFQPLWYKY